MCKRGLLFTTLAFLAFVSPAPGQAPPGTKVGMLNCALAPSIGFIVGGHQTMTCRFIPDGPYPQEIYVGAINTVGLDIGITAGGALAWAVYAQTAGPLQYALARTYVGATGEIGVGVGANLLFGGSGRAVTLQPLSVEGSVGLNLALGISGLELRPAQ